MKHVCMHPWTNIFIKANSTVTCCPQNHTVIGDLKYKEISDIWNSVSAQSVRKLVSNGEYEKAGCDKECPFLRGSFNHPDIQPPQSELINPEFSNVNDDSDYAINYQRVLDNYKSNSERVHSYPLFVDIQPILACNFSCQMCGQPHGSKLEHSPEIAKKIEFLKPFANFFRWQGGEVFLKNSFLEYVVNFDDPNTPHLNRYIITNGSKLTNDMVIKLTSGNRPTHILISIEGASEKTFRKVRNKTHYKQVMSALRILSKNQSDLGRSDLVRWNYVVMRSTICDMKNAIDKADELRINLNFAPIQGPYSQENIFRYPDLIDSKTISYLRYLEEYAKTIKINVSGFTGIWARLNRPPYKFKRELTPQTV